MHIIQEEIGLPVFAAGDAKGESTHRIFTIAPLPPGYGMTLGNALRRVLLSSLPGAAITAARIEGVQHEYAAIKGMKESVLDLTLNLKQVKLRKHSKDTEALTLDAKGPKTVTAGDLRGSVDVDILNPLLVLCTLEKGAELSMKCTVEKGVGYVAAAERNTKQNQPGLMHIDAVFSPVERVRYDVESSRVGQRTDLDKLVMEIVTNGSLTAEEALRFASQLLQSYFQYFGSEKKVEPEFMADFTRTREEHVVETATPSVKESYTPIEILNLSPRTLNALINAGVGSIEQLNKCTEATLTNFRGFGTKALTEVKAALATRGSKLADEVEG